MSYFGDFEHHFQISEDYIPNIWVMWKNITLWLFNIAMEKQHLL